jgi:DNA transposition AAA+ family ATPase
MSDPTPITSATDWVDALAEACERSTQKRIADRIGYSASVVNQVLKGVYRGDLSAVEQAVRGALMDLHVECPVLGELAADRCLEIQRQPFAATNATRVRLYRACRSGCPHSRLQEG